MLVVAVTLLGRWTQAFGPPLAHTSRPSKPLGATTSRKPQSTDVTTTIVHSESETVKDASRRRAVMTTLTSLLLESSSLPLVSLADDVDTENTEASFVPQEFGLDASSTNAITVVDGKVLTGDTVSSSSSNTKVRYEFPSKWSLDPSRLYVDQLTKETACRSIGWYRLADTSATTERLLKATSIGLPKVLTTPSPLAPALDRADVMSGRVTTKNNQQYLELDLAIAPTTCDNKSSDNLGLGFCPYETIYLISASVVNNQLYAFVLECDKSEWKRSNADLRRVRSSFAVQA